MLNGAFSRFFEYVNGEIEAWAQRASGWVMEVILAAFVNAARYELPRGV